MKLAVQPSNQPLGAGPTCLIVVMCGLFAVGLVQTWLLVETTVQIGRSDPYFDSETRSFVTGTYVLTNLLKSAFILGAAGAMAFIRRPMSIVVALAALWFWWPVSPLFTELLTRSVLNLPFSWYIVGNLSSLHPPLVLAATLYLLFSKRIAQVFGTPTRTWITRGAPRLWHSLRGR